MKALEWIIGTGVGAGTGLRVGGRSTTTSGEGTTWVWDSVVWPATRLHDAYTDSELGVARFVGSPSNALVRCLQHRLQCVLLDSLLASIVLGDWLADLSAAKRCDTRRCTVVVAAALHKCAEHDISAYVYQEPSNKRGPKSSHQLHALARDTATFQTRSPSIGLE
jgi:hypothetical protein